MLNKEIFKYLYNNIKSVIIFIVCILAVGIITGLYNTNTNLNNMVKKEFNDINFFDIKLTSDIGFNDDVIEIINNIKEVKGLSVQNNISASVTINNKNYDVNVTSINKARSINNKNYINRLTLVNGRYPITINEGLVSESFYNKNNLQIGSLITLSPENSDYLRAKKIKISGVVKDIYSSNNNVYNVYLNESDFDIDNYNEILITLNNNKKYETNSIKYQKYVNENIDIISNSIKDAINKEKETLISNITDEIKYLEEDLNETYNSEVAQESSNEQIKLISEKLEKERKKLQIVSNSTVSLINRCNLKDTSSEIKINSIRITCTFTLLLCLLVLIIVSVRKISKILSDILKLELLGYNKYFVVSLYVILTLIIIFVSSLFGFLIGSKIFSTAILLHYGSIYNLPFVMPKYDFNLFIKSVLKLQTAIIISIYFYSYMHNKKRFIKLKNSIKLLLNLQ